MLTKIAISKDRDQRSERCKGNKREHRDCAIVHSTSFSSQQASQQIPEKSDTTDLRGTLGVLVFLANRQLLVSTTRLAVAICLLVVYSTPYYKALVYHRNLLGIHLLHVR